MHPWKKEYDKLQMQFWAKNPESALLNSITGIYYACYNDGDDVLGAIENNRCQGFDSLKELLDGRPYDTPDAIVQFLKRKGPIDKRELEKVMDMTLSKICKPARHL